MKRSSGIHLSLMLMAGVAAAADRTWDGGGGDANWKTPANWDGDATCPAAGDALFFGGTSKLTNTNTLDEGTAVAGLTFNNTAGAFSLWGNAITLSGNVVNNDGDAQTINVPITLDAARTFNAVSGNIAVSNSLSGAGGLTKEGAYTLYLTASNAYDGVTTLNTGTVVIADANALGSTAGNTIINTGRGATLNLRGNLMNLAEPITATGGNVNRNCILNETGTNTISGLITTSGGRYNANGGTWLKITGGVTGVNAFFVVNANGTIEFTSAPITIGSGTFHADSGGLTILGVAGNSWGSTLFSGGTMRFDVDGPLPATTTLQIGGVSYGPSCTLNLNGRNQTVAGLTQAGGTPGTVVITSAAPATLTVNQSGTTTYWGQFAGGVNLVKAGTGTLSLSNAVSSTSGSFVVSNGTLLVTAASRLGNSTNVVVAGGTLELRNQTAISDAATLSLATGAKVRINAGLVEVVDRLVVDGVPQASGTYGSSASGAFFKNDTWFVGNGQLLVWSGPAATPSAAATWDAEGLGNTLVSAIANWTNDVLPAFDGTTYATFATGGLTATVDQAVGFYGLTFNRDADFTLAATEAGVVTNGAGGLFAQVPNTTGRTYTLAEDLVLGDNQTWCVTNNGAGGTTLQVTGALDDGDNSRGLIKTGTGTLTLSGASTFDGPLFINNGWLRVNHPQALGSTNGSTTVMGGAGGFLYLGSNLHLAEPLILNGEYNNGGTLRSELGNCVLGGPISLYNQVRLQIYNGTLTVTGGVAAADGVGSLFVINSSATAVFSTTPLNLGPKTFYTDSGGLTVLAVAGNAWADTLVANGTLRLDVPYALPTAASLRLGIGYGPGGTVDLSGNDQTISRLYLGTTNPGRRIIKSVPPATLTVHQNVNDTIDICFTGAVSLVKSGTGTLTFTNAFTSTTGSFSVTNGTLAVTRDGTFGAYSTNIVVAGNGTLALSNSVAIANSATVKMPAAGVSTAKIALAAGVEERVGWLYLGDEMQRVGTYGSSGSGANHKDDTHFSGTGVLRVLHDKSGTLIAVK